MFIITFKQFYNFALFTQFIYLLNFELIGEKYSKIRIAPLKAPPIQFKLPCRAEKITGPFKKSYDNPNIIRTKYRGLE